MPIFEYVCKQCGHRFEMLVQGSTVVACPSCSGRKLEKQLSVFAATSRDQAMAQGEGPVGACGTCGDPRGPGSCSMN